MLTSWTVWHGERLPAEMEMVPGDGVMVETPVPSLI